VGSAFTLDTDVSMFEAGSAWYPVTMVCMALAGVHSLAVVWLWALTMVAWCVGLGAGMPEAAALYWEPIVSLTMLIGAGSIALEFAMALLHREWQTQLGCKETLLEQVTDGFGAVDAQTGVIHAASPKLLETLGSSLVGQTLASALSDEDCAALVKFFGEAVPGGSPPEAVLLTWTSEEVEFDVRMVPYHLEGSRVGFCVQRMGEQRFCNRRPGEAAADAEEEAEEEASQQQQPPVFVTEEAGGAAAVSPQAVQVARIEQGDAAPPSLQHGAVRLPTRRSLGTLSLSSWSLSCDGSTAAPAATHQQQKKKVEMRTVGTQVHPQPQTLPAPLSASSVPKEGQAKALQKRHMKRVCKAKVVEGRAHLKHFTATPLATRGNALQHLLSSFNVDGKGCCSRHIAWMGVQELVTAELLQPCGAFDFFTEWQCPECDALNNFDTFPPMDDSDSDSGQPLQLCCVCHELVEPQLSSSSGATAQSRPCQVGEVLRSLEHVDAKPGLSSNDGSDSDVEAASRASSASSSDMA